MGDEYEWHQPTPEELEVIQARRERNEKLSTLMGQYLLKGYAMLDVNCTLCSNILMRDKSGKDYCICCSELSSNENPGGQSSSDGGVPAAPIPSGEGGNSSSSTANNMRPNPPEQKNKKRVFKRNFEPISEKNVIIESSPFATAPYNSPGPEPHPQGPTGDPAQNVSGGSLSPQRRNIGRNHVEDSLEVVVGKLTFVTEKLRAVQDPESITLWSTALGSLTNGWIKLNALKRDL